MTKPIDKKFIDYANYKSQINNLTSYPIEIVENPEMKSKNAKCKILKYSTPRKYKIVFAGGFYTLHKHNTRMINDIIEHELAHIKYPCSHGRGFKKLAGQLGAPKRYQLPR